MRAKTLASFIFVISSCVLNAVVLAESEALSLEFFEFLADFSEEESMLDAWLDEQDDAQHERAEGKTGDGD